MASMRGLKERINSVHSSQKITGAMKMISSARLRREEARLLQALPYRENLWRIYDHIEASGCEYESPLVMKREVKRLALVVFASDDGLAGAFNINLYKRLTECIASYRAEGIRDITVYAIGRKIQYNVDKLKDIHIEKMPDSFEQKNYLAVTRSLSDSLIERFTKGDFDKIDVVYTYYKSIGTQIVMDRQFLPVVSDEKNDKKAPEEHGTIPWYIYEPDCQAILQMLYPLMLHALMYEMFMENRASEQAARIMAMQMANDNAIKLLGNLNLEYNKLRQQGITTELLDIASGMSER